MKDPTKFVPKPATHLDLSMDQCLTWVGVHACVYASVCIISSVCICVCMCS